MRELSQTLKAYEDNEGWSSKLFHAPAVLLMKELMGIGIKITVGRTVIHIANTLKAYVHHNGRTSEFATITDRRGVELATFHHTNFEKLREFVLLQLGVKND